LRFSLASQFRHSGFHNPGPLGKFLKVKSAAPPGQFAHWRVRGAMLEASNQENRAAGDVNAGHRTARAPCCSHGAARLTPSIERMDFPLELLINAIIAGVLLGGFYVAVTIGISIAFGMLDIVNIAHPAFIILGSYLAYILNAQFGIDPVLVGLLMLPVFYVLGAAVYQVYYLSSKSAARKPCAGSRSSSASYSSPRSRSSSCSASTTAMSRPHTSDRQCISHSSTCPIAC